jgi:mRNA interferase RelE/StbE
MARYEVFLRQSVLKKDLASIPKSDTQRIVEAIRALADNPRPPGVQKLCGQECYRIRQGGYRMVFSIQDRDHTVWITKVGHRRDVYK